LIVLSDLPTLPRGSITALADLTREALHNVEKHAIAQSVVVSVFCQRNGVAVTVADDGVGLDDCRRNDGLGLAAMTERMARVGGTFTMEPNEDGGVTAHGWLPR
jgi:signal transduction histidine kinase